MFERMSMQIFSTLFMILSVRWFRCFATLAFLNAAMVTLQAATDR